MIDFELIVPDGWVQIPTTPEGLRLRKRIIGEIVRSRLPDTLPRDKVEPLRQMLRKELIDATDEASRQGARSVVLPIQEYEGMGLPGSMLLTVLEEEAEEFLDAEKLLASILSDAGDDGVYLEIGGAPAVRVQAVVDSDPIKREAPSRRVSYYVSNPDAPGVWALISFTVLTDGDLEAQPVQAVVLLFDSVVGTLRWANRLDAPTEDEVITGLDELARVGSETGTSPRERP